MPTYLFKVSYTKDGTQGLLRDGGTQRRDEISEVMESLGGSLTSLHYAMGDADAYAIADLPRDQAAVAGSMLVRASGMGTIETATLLTPEEVDEAVETAHGIDYQPPGQ
jgi:uncharacterized protein with GYD domain